MSRILKVAIGVRSRIDKMIVGSLIGIWLLRVSIVNGRWVTGMESYIDDEGSWPDGIDPHLGSIGTDETERRLLRA